MTIILLVILFAITVTGQLGKCLIKTGYWVRALELTVRDCFTSVKSQLRRYPHHLITVRRWQ